LNVRSNHVHLVSSADVAPERILAAVKAYSAMALHRRGLVQPGQKPWARQGSTRHLWSERGLEDACRYVLEGQGAPLGFPGSSCPRPAEPVGEMDGDGHGRKMSAR
jgi:hypothetical protein